MTVTNPENVDITRMQVDTAQIGGGIIEISPELNRVTITATSDTQPEIIVFLFESLIRITVITIQQYQLRSRNVLNKLEK